MSNELDMFQQAGEALASSSPEVKTVLKLAREAWQLDQSIAELQALLNSAQTRWNIIKTKELPDAMAQMGSGDWTEPGKNVRVEIKDFVAGSLPKPEDEDDFEGRERRAAAIRWLEEHDGESLIKTELVMTFGKGEHNVALDLVGRLQKDGFEPSLESGVHPQTLQKFAREKVKAGEQVDFEALGLNTGRYANITFPNKPKVAKGPKKTEGGSDGA